jgi:hypothetical protein
MSVRVEDLSGWLSLSVGLPLQQAEVIVTAVTGGEFSLWSVDL